MILLRNDCREADPCKAGYSICFEIAILGTTGAIYMTNAMKFWVEFIRDGGYIERRTFGPPITGGKPTTKRITWSMMDKLVDAGVIDWEVLTIHDKYRKYTVWRSRLTVSSNPASEKTLEMLQKLRPG